MENRRAEIFFFLLKKLFKPHGLIAHRQHTVESSPCTVSFFRTEESRQISQSAAKGRRTRFPLCRQSLSNSKTYTGQTPAYSFDPRPECEIHNSNLDSLYKILQIKCGIFISSLCRKKAILNITP